MKKFNDVSVAFYYEFSHLLLNILQPTPFSLFLSIVDWFQKFIQFWILTICLRQNLFIILWNVTVVAINWSSAQIARRNLFATQNANAHSTLAMPLLNWDGALCCEIKYSFPGF